MQIENDLNLQLETLSNEELNNEHLDNSNGNYAQDINSILELITNKNINGYNDLIEYVNINVNLIANGFENLDQAMKKEIEEKWMINGIE